MSKIFDAECHCVMNYVWNLLELRHYLSFVHYDTEIYAVGTIYLFSVLSNVILLKSVNSCTDILFRVV